MTLFKKISLASTKDDYSSELFGKIWLNSSFRLHDILYEFVLLDSTLIINYELYLSPKLHESWIKKQKLNQSKEVNKLGTKITRRLRKKELFLHNAK